MRLANLVPPEAMPFTNITSKYFDSGDYPEALRRAAAAIDVGAVRGRQRAGERVGVGFSIFCEQGAHGRSVYAGRGIPMVPGTEQATARLTPDGSLKLRVGVQSHGQGLETTLSQIAHEELGVPVAQIELVHGDTALTPYSTGMGLALRGDGGRVCRRRRRGSPSACVRSPPTCRSRPLPTFCSKTESRAPVSARRR